MNKQALFFVIFFLLLLACCKTERVVYDLREEAPYAREQGGIFAVDLLKPEGDPYVMGGWSSVRIDGTRLGVYPISRLNIPVIHQEPIYLYFKCQPFTKDRIPAKGFRFRVKNKDIAQVGLKEENESLIKVVLLPGKLEWGKNVIQIHHVLDEELEKSIDRQKNKRIRTVVFYEMLLSSHSDYEMTKKFIEAKQKIASKRSDLLIQKVPSVLDFFVELYPDAYLDSRFEFIPADPSGEQSSGSVTISLTHEGKKEEHVLEVPFGGSKTTGKMQADFSVEKKTVSRLRIKAGEEEGLDSFKGLLVWKKATIMGKQEKKIKPVDPDADFLHWKHSLAEKNAVIIILDAARADHFSSFGYFRPTTPNLDKLAEEAVLFTCAYSEALTTRASMGTLFTGFPLTVLSLYSITSQIPEELTMLAQLFQKKKIKTAGFAGVGNVASTFGFDRGFDQYFELYREEEFYRKSQEYLPYLLPWLESNQNNRFFLYVHFKEPHAAYSPLPPFKGMFTDAYEESVDLSVHLDPIADTLTDEQVEFVRAGYDENLVSVDSVVGEIIEKMRSLGMLDESIIIVTADHGELLGEKDRIFGHGGYFGEGGMHIPLFVRFPKSAHVKYPAKVDALVKTSDIFATLADIHDFGIQNDLLFGKSLLSLIREPDMELNPFMVSEKRGTPGYCYRNKKHKLIYWMEKAPIEFYDLEKDPEAMDNVYEQNQILAHFYLANLKKWITSQTLIKEALLKGDPAKREIDMKQIDEKTLENLKALGYIK